MADQITKGNTTKARTSSRAARAVGPKIALQVPTNPMSIASSSIMRGHLKKPLISRPANNSGVTIMMPIASPSHQIRHADQKLDHACTRARNRAALPAEAAAIGVTNAAVMRPTTSRTLEKESDCLVRRRKRYPPSRALAVFPRAIPTADHIGIGLQKLTRNAPTVIAGQTLGPNSSTAANAIPAAGNTGETLPFVNGTDNPSLPAQR